MKPHSISSLGALAFAPVVLALSASAPLDAADWPQWRGPNRDGISTETGLKKEWPEGGPKLVWQANDLGSGYGAPAIADGRIYLVVNTGLENESVAALDAQNGKVIWKTRLGNVGNPDQRPSYPAARSTPTVNGDAVYALTSDGDLARLNKASGKIEWQKSLRNNFQGKPGTWAYAESPLVDGDLVVCAPGGPGATVVALNKKTGETVWKAGAPGDDPAAYASIIPAEANGSKQYVAYVGNGLVGVDAKSGKYLWRYDNIKGQANMPTPIARDGHVYAGTNRKGAALLKLTGSGADAKAEEVYFESKLPAALGGALLVDDHLYGFNGPSLLCAEFKTGKIKWEDRSIGPSSLAYADGHLFLHGEDGAVAMVEASPEGYREKGRFTPPNQPTKQTRGEKAWAYPAIAEGKLYLRDGGTLWVYDLK